MTMTMTMTKPTLLLQLKTDRQSTKRGSSRIAALFFILLGHHRVAGDRFCGVDLDDAKQTCWQPCSIDNECCSVALQCFETGSDCGSGSADLSGANHFFCGTSWCDAAYTCATPCPEQTECPSDQTCYADIPCNSDLSEQAPPLPAPPTSSPYQFCGSSMADAKEDCWQPCPRGDSNCCFGLNCFDTSNEGNSNDGTCTNSEFSGSNHFFCGSSWCDAAYDCNQACSGGTNEECPTDQYCYADVPCTGGQASSQVPDVEPPPSIFNKYCGTSPENAAENCWLPCRDDGDCCGQTCYSEVTACSYPDNIGADHFFCGTEFCDAANECRQPCPSGFDAECESGYRCFANTPCNANVRSMSENMLAYGLPRNANMLFRQYRLEGSQGQEQTTNAAASSDSTKSFHVGLFFGISLICVVALYVFFQKQTKRQLAVPDG